MKEEEIIKQKIERLNDFDLSFNATKGWKELSRRRKKTKKQPWLIRIAAVLLLFGVLWLLASKLAYFHKTEISQSRHKPLKSKQIVNGDPVRHLAEPVKSAPDPEKRHHAVKEKEFKRIVLEIEPLNKARSASVAVTALVRPDSIPGRMLAGNEKTTEMKVVHINEINRGSVHPSSKKERTFFVRVGSENVEISEEHKPKSLSYIIR